MRRITCTLLLALIFTQLATTPAHGLKLFLDRARKLWELDKPVSSCLLCHTYDEKKEEEPDKNNINDFGHDFANDPRVAPVIHIEEGQKPTPKQLAIIDSVLTSLEHEDSDKDGATNAEEFALNTLPGDKKSVPSPAALEKLRSTKK